MEQDPWYADFQGWDNITTADNNLNLIGPITRSTRDASTASTASTVPVGEPERGQDSAKLSAGVQSRLALCLMDRGRHSKSIWLILGRTGFQHPRARRPVSARCDCGFQWANEYVSGIYEVNPGLLAMTVAFWRERQNAPALDARLTRIIYKTRAS